MRKQLLTVLLLSLNAFSFGQPAETDRSQSGDLSLRIKTISFIQNNEYYNPVVEGYSMLGFFLQPELVYTPSQKVSLHAGAHFMKYFGTEEFSMIRPVFSTTLHFTENTSMTIGTLSGPDKHQFLEPHFNAERLYNNYVEDGFQIRSLTENFFTDTWISWENYIFKGDSAREQFTLGESFRYKSPVIANFLTLELPVQLQLKHFGGQISDYAEKTESFINIAAGIRFNFDIAEDRYGQLGIEYLHFANKLQKGDSISGINHGYASWTRLHYSFKALSSYIGYWSGSDFYAPNGNPIYGSVSDYQPGVVVHDRRLITGSIHYQLLPADNLELYFGVDLFYDTALGRLDQAYSLHLNFDKLISLVSHSKRAKANSF